MASPPQARVILHLDMDAFYAAVEVRENPALRGKALIIGHRGRRGVVSTCSYEARTFGVHSAMPSVTAERLCPNATWLPGRMDLYVEVSHRIRRILEDATPAVEPLSIDEAFLDLTSVASAAAGSARAPRRVSTLDDGRRVAAWLKARIRDEERLTASVGVAPNKYLAKVASDLEKPDGLVVLPLEEVPARLWPLPVSRLWGVGPKTAARLEKAGLRTIGDVARRPPADLERLCGESWGAHLVDLAQRVAADGVQHFSRFSDIKKTLRTYKGATPANPYLRTIAVGTPEQTKAALDLFETIRARLAVGYSLEARGQPVASGKPVGEARQVMLELNAIAEDLARRGIGIPFWPST